MIHLVDACMTCKSLKFLANFMSAVALKFAQTAHKLGASILPLQPRRRMKKRVLLYVILERVSQMHRSKMSINLCTVIIDA